MFKKIFVFFTCVSFLALLAVGCMAYWFIALQPGKEIREANLKKVLAVESPVFYTDGMNKIGVFFQDAHRQYIPFERIPKSFILAIIASEDRNFFTHFGVDVLGISRAMFANIKAGRVVQGGSTITQQAAKNLFKRKERSIEEKLKELLYAFRLEYHYTKEKIFEFYANQFYVSGNGRGLGVAAKYFFDKSAQDLTLLESAFIAGSVKRPNYYNPFIKRSEAAAELARTRSQTRTRYVLGQMFKLGMISAEMYQDNIDRPIPFKKGKMSFALNTVMDLIKEALAEPEVEEALVSHGIDNIGTSGIKIYTTIEKGLQEYALTSIRKELSMLSVRLQGYDHRALQEGYTKLQKNFSQQVESEVLFGKVTEVNISDAPYVKVSFGKTLKNGAPSEAFGLIEKEGFDRMVSAMAKYNGQRWTEPGPKDLQALLESFKVGDLVFVSRSFHNEFSEEDLLDLEKYPELQGGFIAIKEGRILAMIGGAENRFFNRAIDAKRLMGSIAKPLVYTAALQLGWNSADLLKNDRDAFVYQNQVYFPRPDHISPFQWVSMSWAGVKSENVASVWLLYHLCDRLSPGQFKDLTTKLGLARTGEESYNQYAERIRDKYGIIINNETLRQLAFRKAVEILGPDLLFDGKISEYELLGKFHYTLEDEVLEDDTSSEAEIRREILKRSFVATQNLYRQLMFLKRQVEEQREYLGQGYFYQVYDHDLEANLFYNKEQGYLYSEDEPGQDWQRLSMGDAALHWMDFYSNSETFWNEISLNGQMTVETFLQVSSVMSQELKRLSSLPAYGPAVLYNLRDFRVLVGLQYLISLSKEMGIRSNLEPVLSFPLGSNVISLLEVAKTYEAIVTGNSYRTGRGAASEGLMIIDRIENIDGEVVYQPKRIAKRLVDKKTSLSVSDILRNVVQYGTGRYAARNIRLHSHDPQREKILTDLDLLVPVLGKTGTANQFRNSAFAGFVPELSGKKTLISTAGYSLAAYVGYDDNLSMERTSSHITGSSGALRVWTELANFIINDKNYADRIDLDDLSFSAELKVPLKYEDLGQIMIYGDKTDVFNIISDDTFSFGAPTDWSKVKIGYEIATFGQKTPEGEIKLERNFAPFGDINQ